MPVHRVSAAAALILPFMLASCSSTGQLERSNAGLELEILHVNDTHSMLAGLNDHDGACDDAAKCRGGYARAAAIIHKAKAQNDNVIALHAGDDFQGTLFFTVNHWQMLSDLAQLMPYDAMTIGNHEFDLGCEALAGYIQALPYPMLAANLTPGPDCPLASAPFVPYLILEVRGEKVGIIGLANRDEVLNMVAPCPDTAFADTKEALTQAVSELEDQGVKHIALTHIGLEKDLELSESVDGLDVIVGGHSHYYIGPGSRIGPYPILEHSPSGEPVLVVTAGSLTQYVGDLKLQFDPSGVITAWEGRVEPVSADLKQDEAVKAMVEGYAGSLAAYRTTRLGGHDLSLPDGMDKCRSGDCLSGLLTADAMLEYGKAYGAQMALCNSGCFRIALEPGDITRGDVLAAIPYDNDLLLRRIKGSDLIAALENGAAAYGVIGPHLLQTAGLGYTVDAAAPAGARVSEVVLLSEAGSTPLDPDAYYQVVVNSFIGQGGDGFSMLAEAEDLKLPACTLQSAVESYLKAHDPLPEPVWPRISWK